VFSRNSSTGALTFVEVHKDSVSGVDGLDGATTVTVSPDGSHVYVAAFDDDAVAVFSRNSSTGALTFVEVHKDSVSGVDGLDGATTVTVSPDGSHVYVAAFDDDAVAVFSRNSSTGALTFVEVHKDGAGGVDGLDYPTSVTVSPDGSHVYVAAYFDDAVAVFSRNSSTGALTFVEVHKDGAGGVDGLNGPYAVTVSPDGSHLYATGRDADAVAVFSRNSSTGALTFVEFIKDKHVYPALKTAHCSNTFCTPYFRRR
jgi:6-phosphogluconolactonase (cycloisomerase 2 family)